MKTYLTFFLSLYTVLLSAQLPDATAISTDYSWKYVGGEEFTYAGMWWQEFGVSLVFNTAGQPYIAFTDWTNEGKATVMKFEGSSWVPVGNPGFSAGSAYYISLALNTAGQPYVAYRDGGNADRATVMKFDGMNWSNVGNAGFSAGITYFTSLAFNNLDQPFVAYIDGGNSQRVSVMKFDANGWVYVGNPGFSPAQAMYTDLKFNSTGVPYIVFQDQSLNNYNRATVMRFLSDQWVVVGNAGFSEGQVVFTSLAFNKTNDQLYVSYQDYSPAYYLRATVMTYDGTSWLPVGYAGFSAAEIAYPSLAISSTGFPFIGYGDQAYSRNATVMKFDGSGWVSEGDPGFSVGVETWQNSLSISPSGVPFFAYKERGPNDSSFLNVMKFDSVLVGMQSASSMAVSCYPNPATDKLIFRNSAPILDDTGEIRLYDVTGIIVKQGVMRSGQTEVSLDIRDLPSGLFCYEIIQQQHRQSGKVIISK